MMNETEERPGVPKSMIVATLFFVVGMVLIVLGMIGVVPVALQQLGSLLALASVVLRVVSRMKTGERKRENGEK